MTVQKFKFIEVESNQEELIIQANNGDLLLNVLKSLIRSPKSKDEIAAIFNFEERQAGYYTSALSAMGLTANYEYNSKNIIGLNNLGEELTRDINKRKLADFLIETEFLEGQRIKLDSSDLSDSTKGRRMQSIEAIERWIGGIENEEI